MSSIKASIIILSALVGLSSCQELSGKAISNPGGGQDLVAVGKLGVGTEDVNVVGGLFAAGNTLKMDKGGPPTYGGFAALNAHGHGLSVEKEITPGIQSIFKENVRVNVFDDKTHKIDTNLFHSKTHLDRPNISFDKIGGSIDYSHIRGHEASLELSKIPGVGSKFDITGKANLWSSPSGLTTLDLTGTRTQGLSGQFSGRNNWNTGLGLTHRW